MEDASAAASPLLPPAGPSPVGNGAVERHLKLATRLSWVANWLLLVLKIAAFALSMSKAVLASLADSAGALGCTTWERAVQPVLCSCHTCFSPACSL